MKKEKRSLDEKSEKQGGSDDASATALQCSSFTYVRSNRVHKLLKVEWDYDKSRDDDRAASWLVVGRWFVMEDGWKKNTSQRTKGPAVGGVKLGRWWTQKKSILRAACSILQILVGHDWHLVAVQLVKEIGVKWMNDSEWVSSTRCKIFRFLSWLTLCHEVLRRLFPSPNQRSGRRRTPFRIHSDPGPEIMLVHTVVRKTYEQ